MNGRQSSSAWLKRAAAFAVAGVALFGVAGCSSDQQAGPSPGTAYIVNGEATSERELTEATEQLAEIFGTPQSRAETALVMAQMQGLFAAVDAGEGPFDEAEMQTQVEGLLALADSSITTEELSKPMRETLYVQTWFLNPDSVMDIEPYLEEAQAGIVMNPRYELQ